MTLNDETVGGQDGTAGGEWDLHRLLFATHGLEDGVTHRLTLTNLDEGMSLAFDMAIISSSAAFAR